MAHDPARILPPDPPDGAPFDEAPCAACEGRGARRTGGLCAGCGGTGRRDRRPMRVEPCPECDGTGVRHGIDCCACCYGLGEVYQLAAPIPTS